jgi:hypothetical protein
MVNFSFFFSSMCMWQILQRKLVEAGVITKHDNPVQDPADPVHPVHPVHPVDSA